MISQEGQVRPLIVKRGVEGFEIADGESTVIDHLVFLVHGIGSVSFVKDKVMCYRNFVCSSGL